MSQRKLAKSAQTAAALNEMSHGLDRKPFDKASKSVPFYTVPSLPVPGRTTWSLAP